MELLWVWVQLVALAFIQNVSFTLVSRARNRDHMGFHMIASIGSNGVWFLTFRILVKADMTFMLFVPYLIGTVAGSLYGAKVAMRIERWLGARADAHVE